MKTLLLVMTFLGLLAGQSAAQAQSLRDEIGAVVGDYIRQHPDDIRAIVKDYLINNPAVLQEAIVAALRQDAPKVAAQPSSGATPVATSNGALVAKAAPLLFESAHQVVLGNPKGTSTLVEFFDYNCGFCKRALGDTMALIDQNPQLRIVLKEFPILGPGSTEAAKIAIALRMQDKDGSRYLAFHERLLGGTGPANRERALDLARQVGADMSKLATDEKSPEVAATLTESLDLARQLGINGTPSYIAGNDIVVGAVGAAALAEKLKNHNL